MNNKFEQISIKPGLRLICSNLLDIFFYNINVKINKTIKTIPKK